MKSIEMSGKTVEDAVNAGLKELGLDPSDVIIDVVDYGSPGLFGMFGRLAKVRLTVKEEDHSLDFEMPVFSLNEQPLKPTKPQKPAEPPKKKPEAAQPKPIDQAPKAPQKPKESPLPKPEAPQPRPEAPVRESAPAKEASPSKPAPAAIPHPGKPRAPKPERREEREPAAPRAPKLQDFPPLNPEDLTERGRCAYEFVSNLTRLMGVEVEIRMLEEENYLSIQMTGDTLGVLIGRRGETLDSLQYLTSLQVNRGREEYTRVSLDTEHYRAKREEALYKLAARMAMRARKTGHRVALEPMNPYERRVLHSALQDNPYVTTHSEGEEPYRRVIITLK